MKHIGWKDILYLLILIIGFAMHYAAFQTRLNMMESTIQGPPSLVSRMDRMEEAVYDIRDSLKDIKVELHGHRY